MLLVISTVLTALNGVVVGYGAVWFQLFGTRPDRDDYLVSLGGYLAAAVLLAGAAAANVIRTGPPWLTYAAAGSAVLSAFASLGSWTDARTTEDRGLGISGVWDGIGGVALWPWSWVIVILLAMSLVRHRRRSPDPVT